MVSAAPAVTAAARRATVTRDCRRGDGLAAVARWALGRRDSAGRRGGKAPPTVGGHGARVVDDRHSDS